MLRLPTYPVSDVVVDVRRALATDGHCVLEAPPGAGKTTIVPLALVGEPWLDGRTILMLEPRRVAARAAARRMAALAGGDVGGLVGYRMRMESRVGPTTRIVVVTEGVLTRLLVRTPSLDDVGLIVFDEFHERSVHADTGLGLALLTRDLVRPDLRLLVMSATLSSLPTLPSMVAGGGGGTIVRSTGRSFPVDTRYQAAADARRLPERMAWTIRQALGETEGDLLCFLPGMADIRRTIDAVGAPPDGVDLLPLHGELRGEEQDRALAPARAGRRKVILSTAIAETSLTIDGVRVVIDGGLSREPRFDPRSGMSRLVTVPVSLDAAEQRRGRAGRTAPGVCYRLWTAADHHHLPERRTPEVLTADLAPTVLDVAAWGATPSDLPWLDPLPDGTLQQATALLRDLEALDAHGVITDHGRTLSRLGAHPRLAHMLVTAADHGLDMTTAAAVAALLGERDILRTTADADLRRRVDVLAGTADADVDRPALQAARLRRDWFVARQHRTATVPQNPTAETVGHLVALAYPERVARQKRHGHFVMRNGRSATVADTDSLAAAPWLAIADLDMGGPQTRAVLAAPLTEALVEELFAHALVEQCDIVIDEGRIRALRRTTLGAIDVRVRDDASVGDDDLAVALATWIVAEGWTPLPWSDNATTLVQRLLALERTTAADVDRTTLLHRLLPVSVLAPAVRGIRRLRDLAAVSPAALIRDAMPWADQQRLDTDAPTHITLARGRRVAIDYADPDRPVVASRLQDFFGTAATPRIAGGRLPLTVHLLSPAGRPVQVTQDLAGFWAGSYKEVRKDLRGRYPKHDWPEQPA